MQCLLWGEEGPGLCPRTSPGQVWTHQGGFEAVIFCRPAGSNIEKRLAKLVSTAHGTARSPTGLENSPPNGSVHRLHPGENEKCKNSQALCPIGSPPRAEPPAFAGAGSWNPSLLR